MSDLLVMSGVNKGYWRGARQVQVLTDVSLQVGTREIVTVVGARDEGKTTLLKLAAGMERPDEGRVSLDGQDLDGLSALKRERLLGAKIAWVSRERPGIAWTARQYVAMPLTLGRRRHHVGRRALIPLTLGRGRHHVRRQALVALEFVGVARCANQSWEELSNWERTLVGLARAYACRPRLIIIDDLLDGYGMLRMQEIGDILRSVVEELGCGVLMSASGMEAALVADNVWSFGRGRLKPMTSQLGAGGDVIDFPKGVGSGTDSRSVGS